MNKFIHILYSTGILQLTIDKIKKWKERNEVDKLEYALRHGLYDIREKSIKALADLKSSSSKSLLIEMLDDDISRVSFAAMEALERIGATPEIENKIEGKKEYWARKEIQRQENIERLKNKKKNSTVSKWDRPSKKTLENVKRMLKKPMNTGKWL